MYGPRTLACLLSTTITLAIARDAAAQSFENVRIIRGCGRVRWDVKILSDDDSILVDFRRPLVATIDELADRPALGPDENTPRQFSERSVYTVDADLYGYRIEPDRTLLLMLRDESTMRSMVAAIPDPDCEEVAATSRAPIYRALRAWIMSLARVGDTLSRPMAVRVSGVGMYDRLRDQPGMARNGFILMPVFAVEPIVPPAPIPIEAPLAAATPGGATTGGTVAASTSAKRRSTIRSKRRTRTRYRRSRRVRKTSRVRRRRYRGARSARRTTTSRSSASRPR